MGFFFKSWYVIWVISLSLSLFVKAYSSGYDAKALTSFFHDYANKSVVNPQTGTLYNIPLPSNFTGMELRFVRLRSGSFRKRGANFSSFYLPPKLVPEPYVKRLAIVYENLGNWSSLYYKVPNHSLVAPVIGFTVYDSPRVLGTKKLNFSIRGEPISIWFDHIELQHGKNDTTPKCVKFGDDGSYVIKNMSKTNGCVTTSQGHFSIVVPSDPSPPVLRMKRKRCLKWWLIGFGGGFIGVVLLVLATTATVMIVKRRRLRAMEKQSEKGVSFDTFWVGRSKMPSASMIRTQPTIEHDYVP
ncbi:hypothetical protein TorRG33x02_223430 [Trema orientale]|uniref:Concanavalin A-like lectin/glucanase domain containing protein n=1 Tax=Trema orientale TaxID=63057 RepID=A0A2P5E8G5_TREOI|nr:hypothetical protein TorRG33x02_223430 [Trema orientale]